MASRVILLLTAAALSGTLRAADHAADSAAIVREFPALPATLWNQVAGARTGERFPASAALRIPPDASASRPAPLVIFLGGSQGESGRHTRLPDEITGGLRVITGSLPLFKEHLEPLLPDESNKWRRLILTPADIRLTARCWEPMLEWIFSETDAIAPGQTVIGGFSNGANAVAGVLNDPELRPVLLARFRRFILAEGGGRLKPGPHLAGCSFLLLEGETATRPVGRLAEPLRAAGAEVEHRVMPGAGHELPATGREIIRAWLRRSLPLAGAPASPAPRP